MLLELDEAKLEFNGFANDVKFARDVAWCLQITELESEDVDRDR